MWVMRQLRVSGALKGPSHQCIKFRAAREAIFARFAHAPSELPSINVALKVPLKEFHRQSFGAASAIPEKVPSCASDSHDR